MFGSCSGRGRLGTDDEREAVPATERVMVGLCHALNDRIAALSAYVYLVERRSEGGELLAALRHQLDRLSHSVRLVRSLIREHTPVAAPVALSVLTESATELMEAYPDGPVVYRPRTGQESAVLRCDWTRTLRALVSAGAWVTRNCQEPAEVEVAVARQGATTVVVVTAPEGMPDPVRELLRSESGSPGIEIVPIGDRQAEIRIVSLS